ncbi:T9SS type A sorting domain-containing protein, partial [candidate division WOR-3 bacterium]|nr:T9SS type A sorting domain-containing protein [candidate division WOR-3 bacterium]
DSKYPQIAFERDGPDGKLWCAWTEGNNSPYEVKFETATFPLVTGKVVTSSTVPYATGLSNAKRMVATGDRLNLVYTSGAHLPQDGGIGRIVPILFPEGNSVYHTYSDDGGITWADSIKIASGGQYPCLIEDPDVDNGLVCTWSEAKWQEFYQPYPGHVYLGSVIKLYLAKYNPSTGWGQPTCISVEFPGLDSLKIIGGPDIAVSTNSDSAWLVWEQLKTQGAPEYIVEPEPPWDTIAIRLEFPSVSLLRGTFLRSNPVETFVVDTIDSHQRGWIRIPVPDTTLHHPIISLCPSVSWQPSLGVRIAWDPWDEEVYIYEWQDTTWIKECISSSDPDRPAQDPHLVGRNNELCCVWVDKSDGNFDTYHYRLLSGPKGESEEKTQFSSMSGYNSLDPINVDGYHTIWVEQSTDGSYKLQYSRYENFEWQPAVTLLEALVSIRYPQAVLMGNVLHYTWTQGAGEPYFICGDTIMIEETPELAVNLGSQESSPYTEQRDGYIEDSDPLKQRDYSETELIYEISGLHGSPGGSHLKLKAYFYHEGEDWKLGLQVDDGQTINKWVAPGSLIVVQKIINESAFKDSTIRITIKSLPPTKNALVVCSGFELYHYQSGGDGGAQSAAGDGTSPHVFKLNQNYPNPFVCKTTIKYAIPRKAKVSLKVYNVAGRLVHTLVNGKKEPGYYTINWDAKEFPSGIYFTKLDAGNYTSTKKLILMR